MDTEVSVTTLHDEVAVWRRELEVSKEINSPEVEERQDYLKEQIRSTYGYLSYLELN